MRIKHFNESKTKKLNFETGKMELVPVLTPSGTSGLTFDGTAYSADGDGWFDVPAEAGEYFVSKPGWRVDIGRPFDGEVVPEPSAKSEGEKTDTPKRATRRPSAKASEGEKDPGDAA